MRETLIDLYGLESRSSLCSDVAERGAMALACVKADQDRQGRLTHNRPQDGQ
jgi:hypothetical protein